MIAFVHRQFQRLGHTLDGFYFAITYDRGVRFHLFTIGGVVAFSFLLWPLSETEILFLTLSLFLILITEFQNTAFERALDRLHPEHHDDIGHSKDIAAASVLLSGIFLFIVLIWIFYNHLF